MTTDQSALLDAVLAVPFDMAPRLVYADLLDERGDHAAAARLRRLAGGPRYAVRRCKVTGFPGLVFHERHGFPFRVLGTLSAFMAQADRLFRTWPVTDVVLTDRSPHRNDDTWSRATTAVGGSWYVWERHYRDDAVAADRSQELPRPIFRFLGGSLLERDWYRAFPSRPPALRALRRAAVRYGRDLVGLPDIVEWPRGDAA